MDELEYDIHAESSHSGQYDARNVKSRDIHLSSRWTAAHALGTNPEFIVLKLDKLSVLKNVLIGKFLKSHPCNVHVFEVHVGLDPDRMTLVARDQLQNNGMWESFNVAWRNVDGLPIPCRYVKIVPISMHHSNFHPSIWHVSLYGDSNTDKINAVHTDLLARKDSYTVRLIAKYLRQRGFQDSCDRLLAQAGEVLEHPHVASLRAAVLQGQWLKASLALQNATDDGLFDDHIETTAPIITWKRLSGTNPDGDVPIGRIEHNMCFDPVEQKLFVIGGWDGKQHVRDFHEYSVVKDRWRPISPDIGDNAGPTNLHNSRAVFDPVEGVIYLFAYVLEELPGTEVQSTADASSRQRRAPGKLALYRYETRSQAHLSVSQIHANSFPMTWRCLSQDLSTNGGPKSTQDFDIALDTSTRTIQFRASRQEDGRSNRQPQLYAYDIRTNDWIQRPALEHFPPLPGRLCAMHSTDSKPKTWMLGGNNPSSTISVYCVDGRTDDIEAATPLSSSRRPPSSIILEPLFSNSAMQELYIFHETGSKEPSASTHETSTLWIYQCRHRRWITANVAKKRVQPPERVLFQSAYDPTGQSFFQFGGLLVQCEFQQPIDELWQARLRRPTRVEILKRAMFLLREQEFLEMCANSHDEWQVLEFLRSNVVPYINRAERRDVQDFCATVSRFYTTSSAALGESPQYNHKSGNTEVNASVKSERIALFDSLITMVNPSAREPEGSLSTNMDSILL